MSRLSRLMNFRRVEFEVPKIGRISLCAPLTVDRNSYYATNSSDNPCKCLPIFHMVPTIGNDSHTLCLTSCPIATPRLRASQYADKLIGSDLKPDQYALIQLSPDVR